MESVFRFFSNPKGASAAEATTDDATKEASATAAAAGKNNQSSSFAEVSSTSGNAFKSNDSRAVPSHIKKMDTLIRCANGVVEIACAISAFCEPV